MTLTHLSWAWSHTAHNISLSLAWTVTYSASEIITSAASSLLHIILVQSNHCNYIVQINQHFILNLPNPPGTLHSIYWTNKFTFNCDPPTFYLFICVLIKKIRAITNKSAFNCKSLFFVGHLLILTQRHVDEWLHSGDNPPGWGRVGGWGPGSSLRLSLSHHWSLHGMSTETTGAMRNRITCQPQIIACYKD